MKKYLPTLSLIIFCILALVFATRGNIKNNALSYQHDLNKEVGSPFEGSNSSARYALVQSIVENKSLFFNDSLARFASPDLVYNRNKFSTIFLPGVSFLAVPFYFVGSLFAIPQLGTYMFSALMGILTVFLVAKLARYFGSEYWQSIFAGMLFLLATNALSYTQTLTQHLPSTFILLSAILIALSTQTAYKNTLFGLLFGLALLIDIPNVFMFLPIVLYLGLKHISIINAAQKISIQIRLLVLYIIVGVLPMIMIFGWYNQATTGSPTLIAQTVGRVSYEEAMLPKTTQDKKEESIYDTHLALNTRKLIQGLYILIVSDERGILYYQPIVIIGILGILMLYRRRQFYNELLLTVSIISVNFLIYMMFGDPWGGWSYGPRYLIPATSLLCIFIGPFITLTTKKFIYSPLILLLALYSLFVSTLGVVTTNNVPPKNEAENLVTPIPYTYAYNLDLLQSGSSSLIYNAFLKDRMSPSQYHYWYFGSIAAAMILFYLSLVLPKKHYKNHTI